MKLPTELIPPGAVALLMKPEELTAATDLGLGLLVPESQPMTNAVVAAAARATPTRGRNFMVIGSRWTRVVFLSLTDATTRSNPFLRLD